MGEYELVLFLTENKISVMEVDLNSKSKIIGFHGEDYFQYDKLDDIDDFYKNITDTYNVDDLSELNTNVFLIDCGMEQKTKWHLIDKLRSCECLNVNNLSCLLPILLSKKGLLQVGKQIVVELLDEKYAYICDDEYHVEELVTRGKKAQQVLDIEDFSFIAVWEGSITQEPNNDYKEEIDKLKQELDTQKRDYDNKSIEYQKQLEQYDITCKSWEEKYEELKRNTTDLVRKNSEKITQDIINRRRLITTDGKISIENRILQIIVENGDNVKSNQIVGNLIRERGGEDVLAKVYAPRTGKIVWLLLDGDDLGANWGKHQTVLGVVGDENDNEDDMVKWAKNYIDEFGWLK